MSYRDIVEAKGVTVKSTTTIGNIVSEWNKVHNPGGRGRNSPRRKRKLKKKKAKMISAKQRAIATRRRLAATYARAVAVLGTRRFPKYGTSRRIATVLRDANGIAVSPRTIRRDMTFSGFRSLVRPKVSGMTEQNKKDRLRFARTFTNRYRQAYDSWPCNTSPHLRVVFSDEHFITTNDYTCRYQYAKHRHELHPRESKHRFNTKCLMLWAAIGYNYKSPIIIINQNKRDDDGRVKRLDQHRYHRNILVGSGVIRDCARLGYIFMQDGARCHIAEKCLNYIRRQGCVHIDNWPPHSPELNPIEMLWAHLNEVVSTNYPPADSVEELGRQVVHAWNNLITQETINNFVLSFQGSLAKCRANRGLV
jgi:transposase